MLNSTCDSPAALSKAHTWRSGVLGVGLFCAVGGLFLAAGFKEVLWPKAMVIGGIVLLVVGLVANAVASRVRPASGD